jgi:uncharacterized protein YecE (DUF72 family)
MARRHAVHVGCSGWHYGHWAGRVYPDDVPRRAWLAEYARRFDTVELNNSFYRLPSEEQFSRWREQVPEGFVFSVKASRYLTHFKRLTDPEEPLDRMLSRAVHLGPALGPILYQLPPGWVPDADRFLHFLELLPASFPGAATPLQHVVEFRDPRCYAPHLLELLDRYGITLCVHDMPGAETPRVRIGPSLYLRLHGFGSKYGGSYPPGVLEEWASWVTQTTGHARDGYVYFNNDREAHAVHNAETLRSLLGVAPRATPARA